jgi:hypothetical protein
MGFIAKTQSRAVEIGIGIGLAGIALAASPVGLRIATGRLDLNLRIEVLSLTLAVFLLIWSGAFISYGSARRAFFYLIVWSFPLALLAAVEAGAVAVRLSEWIAPTEDKSILNEKDRQRHGLNCMLEYGLKWAETRGRRRCSGTQAPQSTG